jgi:hypothetical protein
LQEFINWTIETIREDRLLGSWLEESKYEWVPLVSKSVVNILDNGKSVLVLTDNEHHWFMQYILTHINNKKLGRPFLPFYDFNSFHNNIDSIKNEDDIQLIKDMLDISFPNGYFFWYIGRGNTKKATLAKFSKHPFLWIMDEEIPNSFILNTSDESLDMRLLQMYRLFDKTLSAALFAQIDVTK